MHDSTHASITIGSDGSDADVVVAAARAFAERRGASGEEVDHLESVLSELVTWVANNCYPPPASGVITVRLTAAEDGLHISIADTGVPLRSFGTGRGRVPYSLALLAQVVSDLHLVNLGSSGKQLRCYLPTARPLTGTAMPEPAQVTAERGDVQARLATADDAVPVGRVMHVVYGLGYGHEGFYDPNWLVAAWDRGDVISAVGLVRDEVVAHLAFLREPDGECYEIASAAVDPRYRSLGLSGLMGATLYGEVERRGIPAVSAHMVTTHTRSQVGPSELGFVPTGLLLGAAPAQDPSDPTRQTLLIAYFPVERRPRPVALPAAYADAMRIGYERLGLDLAPQDRASATAELGDAPSVELAPHAGDASPVLITVRRWEPEDHAALMARLRSAVRSTYSMIYIDLDLHTLTSEQLDEIRRFLRTYDFFAGALLLYGRFGHDHLRMQAILTHDLQLDQIALHSEQARELRAAIFRDHDELTQRLNSQETA